ncbi:MAG: glycosyltransferase family 4 protein [Bdellovibrionaceae bacterium]|nr:glycosyltransferase family 4 protein [Pseudobdellovibrionaceae bacterium]
MRKIKPDIYHAFTIKMVIYGGICCRILRVKKYILTITGLGSLFLNDSPHFLKLQKLVGFLYRWIFASKKSVALFQNEEDKKYFEKKNWIDPKRTLIIPGTGVDCSKIVPSYSTRNEKTQILYAGRIMKDKGITELINACENIFQKNDKLVLNICGELDIDNPSRYSDEEWKKLSSLPFVKCHGFQSNMKSFFERTDFVCLPSYREGLPLFLIEAGAYGKVAITTDVPGCNSIIENNVNGLIVKVKDSSALQLAIEALIEQPELRYKMGMKARKKIENEYDSHILLNKYLDMYK